MTQVSPLVEEQVGSDELTGLAKRRKWKHEAKHRLVGKERYVAASTGSRSIASRPVIVTACRKDAPRAATARVGARSVGGLAPRVLASAWEPPRIGRVDASMLVRGRDIVE